MSGKRVTRIDELAQSVPPELDLWPAIAAAIDADKVAMMQAVPTRRRAWLPAAGMAAAVALVAIGVGIGLQLHPGATTQVAAGTTTQPGRDAAVIPAAFERDQKYRAQRDALLVEVQGRLKTMSPADRAKVEMSLTTLRNSIAEIEAALGHDPANALLQELFVNSCQEEMRALTAVRDSGSQEI